MNIKECDNNNPPYQYLTEFGEVNNTKTVIFLNNQSMLYTITKIDIFNEPKRVPISAFMFDNRYSSTTFQGIILDNRAARISTTSLSQVIILNKLDLIILVNSFIAGNYWIKFRAGEVLFFGTIQVDTQLGNIMFYMFLTNTLFLFYLQDIDRIGVNLTTSRTYLFRAIRLSLLFANRDIPGCYCTSL
jgi:hypothetical protein